MMEIAILMTDFLIRKGVVDEKERDLYEYGCDITLYTILSTVGLLLIGLVCMRFWETAMMVAVFYTCQSYGGGYHAHTHLRCFVSMVVGLVVGLMLLKIPVSVWFYYAAGAVSAGVLLAFPLVLHKNKSYLEDQRGRLSAKSRIATCLLVAAIALCALAFAHLASAGCVALMLAAVSRMTVWFHQRAQTRRSAEQM